MKKLFILSLFIIVFSHFGKSQGLEWYLRTGFTDVTDLNSWTDDPFGGTPSSSPGDFVSLDTWYITNNPLVTLSTTWSVTAAEIVIGDGTGSTTFSVSQGAAASYTTGPPIKITNSSTYVVDGIGVGFTNVLNPEAGSTVNLGSSGPTSVPPVPVSYYNLIINRNMTMPFNTTVAGTLTLNSTLINNGTAASGRTLTVSHLAGGSSITGATAANSLTATNAIIINGTGGTLNLAANNRFAMITVNLSSPSNTLTLGTNLNNTGADSRFNLTQGILSINNRTLTSSAAFINFGSGTLMGNGSSVFSLTPCTATFVGSSSISGSLLMETGSSLKALVLDRTGQTMLLGNTLNITDSVKVIAGTLNSNSNLTLKSTSSLRARIGRTTGTISGDVTAETFVPGNFTGWCNWGSNGVNGQQVSSWANTIPMAVEGYSNGVSSAGGYFESVQGWNENPGDYDTTIVASTGLTPGRGFWVYVGSGPSTTTDYLLSNSGTLVQNTQNIAVTSAGTGTNTGYNLVANPYASPISWAKVLALSGGTSNFDNAIYVWNADLSGGSGAYSEHSSGVSVPGGTSGITDIIPAGQGFFVKANTSTNLVFNESVKMTSNTSANPLLKSSATAADPAIGKVLRLKVNGSNNDEDEMAFRIHPMASSFFDKDWDAYKIFKSPGYLGYPGSYSKYTTISSKDPMNVDYAIHSFAAPTQDLHIPVLVRGMATGNYTITGTETENMESCVMLLDKLENKLHDLKSGPYAFQLNDTTSTPRFELILCRTTSSQPVGIEELNGTSTVFINQDEQGAYVNTDFAQNTKATISAYNVVGQKLMEDVKVEGMATSTRLNLNIHNQVVIIKVTSENVVTTKKIIAH